MSTDYPDVMPLAKQVAKLIGWEVIPRDKDELRADIMRAFLRKDGMRIGLAIDYSKRDRLNVNAWDWPKYTDDTKRDSDGNLMKQTVFPNSLRDPSETQPFISVSLSKTPEQIARDIQRRLLADYERIYQRCKEKADMYQAHNDKATSQWQRVCKVFKLDPKRRSHYVRTNGERSVNLEDRNGSLYISTYLEEDELLKVFAALGRK